MPPIRPRTGASRDRRHGYSQFCSRGSAQPYYRAVSVARGLPSHGGAEYPPSSKLHSAPDRARVEAAALSAGANEVVDRLPHGYKTQLGKWFVNGTDLSRGEWQRLALARAFLRQGQIIILDEPTSSLDVWSEADWFDRFRRLADGRTAVIITHRLPIAKRADLIHVIADGDVVESGTHEDLLGAGGLYAKSWLSQVDDIRDLARNRSVRGAGLNRVK